MYRRIGISGVREIRRSDLRRHVRSPVSSAVVIETRTRWLKTQLMDLSLSPAKVRLTEPLEEGTTARLYFLPPYWRRRVVNVIVWRVDLDGVVLFFTN
jgi:hypothetical protein